MLVCTHTRVRVCTNPAKPTQNKEELGGKAGSRLAGDEGGEGKKEAERGVHQ